MIDVRLFGSAFDRNRVFPSCDTMRHAVPCTVPVAIPACNGTPGVHGTCTPNCAVSPLSEACSNEKKSAMNTNNPPHPFLSGDAPAASGDRQLSGSLFYTPAGLSRFVESLVDDSATRGYDPTCGSVSLFLSGCRPFDVMAC